MNAAPVPQTQNRSVLVVEDDHDVRVTLRLVLEDEGFEVHTATNGKHALDLLRQLAHKPALVLLDLMMPVMDGWEFAEFLQNDAALAGIPFVVQSAFTGMRSPPQGALAVLKKPLDVDALVDLVARHCR